jgi:MFS family permease
MTSLFLNRNFSILWLSRQISRLGDGILLIALPFFIYDLTGSTLAASAMFIAQMVPNLLFGILAGVFVDRWDQKKIMIVSELLRTLLLFMLFFVNSAEILWLIYLVTFMQSSISTFFNPASRVMLLNVVDEKEFMEANSINSISNNVVNLIGPSLGGALLGMGSFTLVVFVSSISFFLSATLILFINVDITTKNRIKSSISKGVNEQGKNILFELKDGLLLIIKDKILNSAIIFMVIVWMAQGVINVLFLPFVTDFLHGGAIELGWLQSAAGIGGILGGLVLIQLKKFFLIYRLISYCAATTGVFYLVVFNFPSLILTFFLYVFLAIPTAIFMVSIETLLQKNINENYRGRFFGAYGTVVGIAVISGMLLSGLLEKFFGVVPVLNVAALLFIVSGIYYFVFTRLNITVPNK